MYIGLKIKPSKTRIIHTLNFYESEDGKAGFDFLGYYIQQFPVSIYKQHTISGQKVPYKSYLTSSQKNQEQHSDYALITNFNSTQDSIQLAGTINDYVLGSSGDGLPSGIGIYLTIPDGGQNELIAIVQGDKNLSLDASYFIYLGWLFVESITWGIILNVHLRTQRL